MADNLFCSNQKVNSDKYLNNYDRIFADKVLSEVAVLEISLNADGRINASEVTKSEGRI